MTTAADSELIWTHKSKFNHHHMKNIFTHKAKGLNIDSIKHLTYTAFSNKDFCN